MNSIQKVATRIVKTLQQAGFIAYFAGGWVRDFLMGLPSDDIDIASSATTDEVASLFPKTIPVGVSFGILIVVEEGYQFEIATFRKDHGYEDGRRPTKIEQTDPIEDAKRRDFTINGMFYDPINEILYDYVGGKEDIKAKLIRAIGDPEARIEEDRLRMMRAVRYATRFGFSIHTATLAAIQRQAPTLLPSVAHERIWQEFKKMASFNCFDQGLLLLHNLGLLSTIFPSLKEVSSNEMATRVAYIPHFPKETPPFAELLELFPDYDLKEVFYLAEFLKLSKKESAFATFYYRAKELFSMPTEWIARLEPFEWAQFYADGYSELCLGLIATKQKNPTDFINTHEERKQRLLSHIERIKTNAPYLRAEHLIALGLKPGKELGILLKEAMRIAINENIIEPSALLNELKKRQLF